MKDCWCHIRDPRGQRSPAAERSLLLNPQLRILQCVTAFLHYVLLNACCFSGFLWQWFILGFWQECIRWCFTYFRVTVKESAVFVCVFFLIFHVRGVWFVLRLGKVSSCSVVTLLCFFRRSLLFFTLLFLSHVH